MSQEIYDIQQIFVLHPLPAKDLDVKRDLFTKHPFNVKCDVLYIKRDLLHLVYQKRPTASNLPDCAHLYTYHLYTYHLYTYTHAHTDTFTLAYRHMYTCNSRIICILHIHRQTCICGRCREQGDHICVSVYLQKCVSVCLHI
jgi:hypothetical protein